MSPQRELVRTRKAFSDAGKELELLRHVGKDPDEFRRRFISTIALARRVGTVLDEETKGRRTAEFERWWSTSREDPLHVFMANIRNAELKRGETTIRVDFRLGVRPGRRHTHYSVVLRRRTVALVRRRGTVPTRTQTWVFDGEEHDGEEVIPLVGKYVSWLGELVLPTAERLTT